MAGGRKRVLPVALALIAFWTGSGTAFATVSDELCGGAVGSGSFPADAEIIAAARSADAALVRGGENGRQVSSVVAQLQISPTTTSLPSATALARYCTIAGEAMRLSPDGTQLQALTYLMTAYRQAMAAGDPIAARAAYQYGLSSVAAPAGVAVRGGGGPRRSGSDFVVAEARQAESDDDDSCATLASINVQRSSHAYLSSLALQCAIAHARRSGDAALSARASLRLARLRLYWAESPAADAAALRSEALDAASAAIPVAAGLPPSELRNELLGRLAATMLDAGGRDHEVLRRALSAMQQGQSAFPGTAGLAAALEARLALLGGDLASARAWAENAVLFESRRPLPARLPEIYLLLSQADPANRERHVFAAYTALGNIRPLLPRLDPLTEETSFHLYMRRVFEAAADVQLITATGQAEGARVRVAQEIIEAFRQAELQSAVGSECLPPRQPLQVRDLRPEEIVLYPVLLPDRIEILYVSGRDTARGDGRYRRLPPNRSANRQAVARLVEQLVISMSAGTDDAWREPSRRLYELLISPIEHLIQPGSMLAIIPDGPLRALPFAALMAPDGQFLIQKSRLGVAPALAYLQPGQRQNADSLNVVAVSLQQEMRLPAGYFSALDGTTAEAQIAARAGQPGVQITDFRRSDLETALSGGQVDVLHLATHAAFNARADRAFIVANGEVIRLPELREIIARNRARGDELDLLILSACETAVGDDEASMGLAGATVQAGALSAIASLWQVEDAGTAELMRQFYQLYRSGRSRSEALREAQLALINNTQGFARPRVWAAFILLGAWR